MKRAQQMAISEAIATGIKSDILAAIDAALVGETGKHWIRDLNKLKSVIADNTAHFSIFAKDGNGKLPFLSFSALPGAAHCPGAGDCLTFCYSFKAWRYPAAFARQCQNSWLLQSETGRKAIAAELDTFRPLIGERVDFRLYVDGDFDSVFRVGWWMRVLLSRQWLRAYGYSKSFAQLLGHHAVGEGLWPNNYKLNLSSGHRHDEWILNRVKALPITRGEFVAVNVGHAVKSTDHGKPEHNAELRAAYGRKAFTCPGRCGTCTPKGHACGSDRFNGIDIIIAAH